MLDVSVLFELDWDDIVILTMPFDNANPAEEAPPPPTLLDDGVAIIFSLSSSSDDIESPPEPD